MTTPVRYRPPKSVRMEWGPCLGMRDSLAPSTSIPDHAQLLNNLYSADTEFGAVVVGRPGLSLLGSQMGASGARLGQRSHQYTKKDGTERTLFFCNGTVYLYDWSGDSLTVALTQAQIASAGAALSSLQRVYTITFADFLIVSDGQNAPWAWDGTVGGGVTPLSITTNVNKAAFGQPWIYYNKLFFILAGARNTQVWSEEADPTIGYEVGGYNNAWDMIQTSSEQLVCGVGLNEAMVIFRPFSITLVQGAVTTDFQSTGTREGISETIGCIAPGGVTVYEDTVYFIGSDRRFYRFRPGTGLQEVGLGIRATMARLSRVFLAEIIACKWTLGKQVLFLVTANDQDSPGTVIAINVSRGEVAGIYTGWRGMTLDEVLDGDDIPTLVHLGGATATAATDGYAYRHGNPDQNFWADVFQSGTVAITHTLVTGAFAFDEFVDKQFTRVDFDFPAPATMTEFDLNYQTTRVPSSAGQTVDCVPTGLAMWDDVQWDDFEWAEGSGVPHVAVGINGSGRWLSLTMAHDGTSEQFGVSKLSVVVTALDQQPKIY